jgi:hypothetical protein
MKIYHYFTLVIALTISVCAAYYSIVGLAAIFAAAALPVIIMGSVLEAAKLTGAVWLKIYWKTANWWIKFYLVPAILVLMLITSMGIFGFLSKAHIEQTAGVEESIAKIEKIDSTVEKFEFDLQRAQQRIEQAETSSADNNELIQEQIDKEQQRIDSAYSRVQPSIDEQTEIIRVARETDSDRTKPYEDQLSAINNQLQRLEQSANDYEQRISEVEIDNSAVSAVRAQISNLEETITVTTNKLQSRERIKIQEGQAVIGVTSDGLFGGNTRRALEAWVTAQQERIASLVQQESQLQTQATDAANAEKTRLRNIVNDIRNTQIPNLKAREADMLAKIEQARAEENPVVVRARDEINRIRSSAEQQIVASNNLIQQLRNQLSIGRNAEVDELIAQQRNFIAETNADIDQLLEEKFLLETEIRKLEAEVGPVKYLAELIYQDADKDTLEDSVRWVIFLLVAVFDPLAVILTLAAISGITAPSQKKSFKGDTIVETVEVEKIVEVPVETIKEVEVEKIVEVIKEVEVEVEKVVEKLVEVPVETIKEVEVEKIVEVEDQEKITELANEVENLLTTIDLQNKKIKQLESTRSSVRNQPSAEPDFDLGDVSGASFGTTWPTSPTKGQLFLKTDTNPYTLYKWNSKKWIEIDRETVDETLAYDRKYIEFIVNEIKAGRQEYENLSSIQQNQVKAYIINHGKNT